MIDIQFLVSDHKLENTDQYISKIESILEAESKEAGMLQYIFCDDAYLLEMNQKFLDHDTLTDIITFDYTEDLGALSGDIFISLERVKENAIAYDVSFEEELMRVMIHGVLHLLGEKDGTAEEKERMRSRENYYLSL